MNPVVAIRAWLAWFRRRKAAPIAQARARRADMIRANRKNHRSVTPLYRVQRAETVRQLRMEMGR
jgi:hypothetical protein